MENISEANEPQVLLRRVNHQIAALDELINLQLNNILHHPLLQALEARWRGLSYIIDAKENSSEIIIKLLDITWQEMHRDLTRHMEFDQSELFAKIYSAEFGSPGGKPFGLLIGDYTAHIQGPTTKFDFDVLEGMASIAAASFAPFVAAVAPTAFGVDDFANPLSFSSLDKLFKQEAYGRWRQLRNHPDTRFVGLTMPRVILRAPYENLRIHRGSFRFQEKVTENIEHYLWGNGSFAFGVAVVRSFLLTGWPGTIRGAKPADEAGGIIEGLPVITHYHGNLIEKFSTELLIDTQDESYIADSGLIPICQYADTGKAILYSNASVFNSHQSGDEHENINMKLSSMLQYILSASRFAHYVKILGRDWIGTMHSTVEVENKLNRWITDFVASNDVDGDLRIKYPLQEAKVEVTEKIGTADKYRCVIYLRPKLQLEKVDTTLKLITELQSIQ